MSEHPERNRRQEQQKRANQLTALFAGVGTGLAFTLLLGLLLGNWAFAVGVGGVIALGVIFGLNAIREDSREIVDEAPESEE